MAGRAVFHPLAVADVTRLTDDACAVEFAVPAHLAEAYRFLPGQHLTVRTPEAGDDARRVYSICAPRSAGRLRIGVKRLPGGGFSSYAMERMRPGDLVDVMTPVGRFCVTPDPDAHRHLVCVAAGSGITPILSIAASVLAEEPHSRVTLLVGNRSVGSVMFFDELEDLKDRYLQRVSLFHVLSREPLDNDLTAGRIDATKLDLFLGRLIDPASVDAWYLCGPHAMVAELRTALAGRGVPRSVVHDELFYVGPARSVAAGVPDAGESAGQEAETAADGCEVTAQLDGRRSMFRLARKGVPVLEGLLAVRPDAPFSCRGGVCGTCRAKVLEGSVRMDQCYALEPDEVAAGYALTCQSHPTSERLVVDYDA